MDIHESPDCERCGHDLFELDGEWFCEACDSESGFELTREQDSFSL